MTTQTVVLRGIDQNKNDLELRYDGDRYTWFVSRGGSLWMDCADFDTRGEALTWLVCKGGRVVK